MNDQRRPGEIDPAWRPYQYPDTGMDDFSNAQPSASTSRRGVKRRKDSGQVEAENARRAGGIAPGHIGSDGFGHGMMGVPGTGVNPEDIHPQLDFTAFDHETVAGYLERNSAIPKFGYGSIHSVWDVNAKATDPRLLFIDEPEPISTMLSGQGLVGPGMMLSSVQPGKGAHGRDASHQASPRDREGRATKRRSTATSMVAAAIEESITMAEEEERKRKERESDGQNAPPAGDVAADGEDTNATNADVQTPADGDAAEAKDDEGDNPNSPPTLRRSSRKPLPAGTSLAVTYRNTRSSPSPTPSFNSEDDVDPFVPILADIDAAKKVFAERAQRHWRDALAAGGGATVQGPGVNPAFAGQVMMGGTGGMMREGEVVAEFLYSTRVKNKALKVATHYSAVEPALETASTMRTR